MSTVISPNSPDSPELLRIREQISDAVSSGRLLNICGGGTKSFYGEPAQGDVLDVSAYSGIASYEPTELVITARAGTRLSEVQAVLAEQGQMLPFEPPSFGAESTIGGVISAGLSGPRRASAGSARDYVLGASLVNSSGEWLAFGGQVMKNVAGYDVSRLLCGSMGILGVIAEVSLKVLPLPAQERSMQMPMGSVDAIRLANTLAGKPIPISATAWRDGVFSVRLSGAGSAVDRACDFLRSNHEATDMPDAARFWAGLRDHTDLFFGLSGHEQALWRLSVPGTAASIDLPGQQLIEWLGAQRWLRTDAPSEAVRAAAVAVGGSAALFRGGDRSGGVFAPLSAPLLQIHKRLKAELDPHGVFNPGRLYPGL
ncbi:MAG: glycolate oxidase subunit GlcE [Burkholderiaceae bacterium]